MVTATASHAVIGVSLKPKQFTLEPGERAVKEITVKNSEDSNKTVKIMVRKDRFGKNEEKIDSNVNRIRPDWFNVTPKQMTIPPKKEKTFTLSVKVPDNSNLNGEYRAMVYVRETSPVKQQVEQKKKTDGAAAVISNIFQVGMHAEVKIAGTQEPDKLQLEGVDFTMRERTIPVQENGDTVEKTVPLPHAKVKVANKGNNKTSYDGLLKFRPLNPDNRLVQTKFNNKTIRPNTLSTFTIPVPYQHLHEGAKYNTLTVIKYGEQQVTAGQRVYSYTVEADTAAKKSK